MRMIEANNAVSQEGVSLVAGEIALEAEEITPSVAAITHEFFPTCGGIATYVMETAKAAAKAGYRMSVWAPDCAEISETSFPFGIRALGLKGTQGWPDRMKLMLSLLRRRKELKGKLIWLPEPGPMRALMYMSLIMPLPGKGLVITLHGSEIDLFSRPPYRRRLFGRLLRKADRVSVVSNYCKDRLLERYPDIAGKVCVVNGALRSDVTGTNTPVSGELKNGRIVILTVGRIHPRKGQLAVVEALAKINPKLRERFVYRCVGPARRPAYLDKIRKAAEEASIAFEYLGELDNEELNEQYRKSDIFAMTSCKAGHSVEGFGLTYLEASSYGLPVVAHRTGGVGDAVKNGVTGIKIDPDDRESLTRAFTSLALSKELRRELGENGRKWARSFSWHNVAHMLFAGVK